MEGRAWKKIEKVGKEVAGGRVHSKTRKVRRRKMLKEHPRARIEAHLGPTLQKLLLVR